jgi:hypothetical protein
MAESPEIKDLRAFKAKLVEERRKTVKEGLEKISQGSIFLAIQTQIDAIDRAIADEESLQPPTSSSAEFGRR